MNVRGPNEPILFIYRLKPGMGDEYDRLHRAVWPDIVALLDEAGIYDYQIWRHDEIVVSRMRTRFGYEHTRAVTAASDVQARWTGSLGHIFEQIVDATGNPLWLKEVFSHEIGGQEKQL